MKKLTLTLALILTLGVFARADKLRLDRVPAEAHWLIHIDVDEAKRSELWKLIEEQARLFEVEDMWEELDDVEQELGIHPLEDIRSVTIFGDDVETESGVVMIHIRGSADYAIERVSEEPEFRRIRRNGLEMYRWSDGGDHVLGYAHRITGSDDSLILLSDEEDQLVQAARVLNRDAISMESSEVRRLREKPAPGSFVFIAAEEGLPGMHDVPPASVVTELAESVYLSFGESRGQLQVHVSVTARNNEDAMSMADIFEGGAALARLGAREAFGQDSLRTSIFDILRALQVHVRGNTVTLDWEYDVRQLFEDVLQIGKSF